MSEQIDKCCNNLRDRLDVVEERVKSARSQIATLPTKGEKVLREQFDKARDGLQSRRQRVEQAVATMTARAQQRVAETKEEVNQWKAKRDARKLEARAERAEAYAADAIDFAVATIDEADTAILDAVVARLDADVVQ